MNWEIEHLKWDSDFINLKIGKVFLNRDYNEKLNLLPLLGKKLKYNLIYIFTDEHLLLDTLSLNSIFHLADRKIVYTLQVANQSNLEYDNIIEIDKGGCDDFLREELFQLAYLSGEFSRFRRDGRLPQNLFIRLYQEWVERSLDHTLADKVFLYLESEKVLGFITLNINTELKVGEIGLLAVSPVARGRNIGRRLIEKCIIVAKESKLDHLTVPTQLDNAGACSFYERVGFHKKSLTNIYHLWI